MTMDNQAFRDWSHRAADWGADYRASLRERPVRPQAQPGSIAASIAQAAPEHAESMETIFAAGEVCHSMHCAAMAETRYSAITETGAALAGK